MEFRIVIKHTLEAAQRVADFVKEKGVKINDVKETNIIDKATKKILDDAYILCCSASEKKFERLKKEYFKGEIEYEGFRTIM